MQPQEPEEPMEPNLNWSCIQIAKSAYFVILTWGNNLCMCISHTLISMGSQVTPRNHRNKGNPRNLRNQGNLRNHRNQGNLRNHRNQGNLRNLRNQGNLWNLSNQSNRISIDHPYKLLNQHISWSLHEETTHTYIQTQAQIIVLHNYQPRIKALGN